jgi:predicted nucleic acid-binding protein
MTETILFFVAKAYEFYLDVRARAKAAGITDEQLAAITADYDARIARRDAEAAAPPVDPA